MDEASGPTVRVKIWDGAIRIVHWALVLLLVGLWWTEKQGNIELHKTLGFVTLALVVFRIYWGLFGGETARFSRFVKGPAAAIGYLRTLFSERGEPVVGHNPLGGWSAIALMAALAVQVGLGLFTQDTDGIESGPLAQYVSWDTADLAREWHETMFNVLLALIALHVAAILFYLIVKRDNLVGPMVSGHRRVAAETVAPRHAPWWRALPGIALAAALAWWVSLGCPLP